MPLPYIETIPLHPRTKMSWRVLLGKALKTWDFEGYLYIYQHGMSNLYGSWQYIDYQNCLRAVRAKSKPQFRPISQARWWLEHRLGCFKRGVRIPLETAINYTK